MVVFGAIQNRVAAISIALIAIGAGMFFISMLLPTLTEFQIGPSGFAAKLRQRDAEVEASLSPESEGLLNLAVQLAGGEKSGQELLERALVETYMRWSQAKRDGPAEAVRAQLHTLVASTSGPGPADETTPTDGGAR